MTETERDQQVQEISDALRQTFVGKDVYLSLIAALSISVTSAGLINMGKLDIQELLIRLWDKRDRLEKN